MAVIPVNLTSESFHHLMQIIEAAIDTSASPIVVKPAFLPLLKALHQMVVIASVTPHGSPIPAPVETTVPGTGELQITLPKKLDPTEQKMVDHLDHMVATCALSIQDVNSKATYKIVLEV